MKVGDLVVYRHSLASEVMYGIVLEVRKKYYAGKPERAWVHWSIPSCNDYEVMDWVDDLEVLNEHW